MGEAGLGTAFPDGSGSLRALLQKAQTGAQEADRLGQANAFASQALAAWAKTGRGDGCELRCYRFSLSSGETGPSDHSDRPFSAGCGSDEPAPKRIPGQNGRPRKKGSRLPTLEAAQKDV